jgi:solute carrier family 25 (mitochondrial phosphate transporter), member 23/24/25/41
MVAPLERLRTIMMASPTALTMKAAIHTMWRDGGLRGMFRGNMASVVKVLPSSAVQFAVYDGVGDALKALRREDTRRSTQILDRLVAGIAAGAASCVATYPLETIRTMMCVPGIAEGTFLQTASHALRSHGLIGLYSGFSTSLLGDMVGTGLGFMAYEVGNQLWERSHGHKPTAAQKGAIGACSAFVVMTCTMPLELIQRRMQVRCDQSAL